MNAVVQTNAWKGLGRLKRSTVSSCSPRDSCSRIVCLHRNLSPPREDPLPLRLPFLCFLHFPENQEHQQNFWQRPTHGRSASADSVPESSPPTWRKSGTVSYRHLSGAHVGRVSAGLVGQRAETDYHLHLRPIHLLSFEELFVQDSIRGFCSPMLIVPSCKPRMHEPQKMGAAFSEVDCLWSVLVMHPDILIHKSVISYVG